MTLPAAFSRSIGTLSSETGVKVSTIRFYEKIGLMPVPLRSAGAYRMYDDAAVARLSFIRRSRQLGFGVDEIRSLLDLADAPGRQDPAATQNVAQAQIATIDRKLAELKTLKAALGRLQDNGREGRLPMKITDAWA